MNVCFYCYNWLSQSRQFTKKNKNKNKFILPVVLEGGRSELTDFGGGLLEGGSFTERHQASYGKNQSPSWLLWQTCSWGNPWTIQSTDPRLHRWIHPSQGQSLCDLITSYQSHLASTPSHSRWSQFQHVFWWAYSKHSTNSLRASVLKIVIVLQRCVGSEMTSYSDVLYNINFSYHDTRVQTQGLEHARQALHHWATSQHHKARIKLLNDKNSGVSL